MNGTDLLAEFRERRSEEAFRELVLRYTNLVFSVAKRRVSNASLAEEITQIVFIRLAKAAPKLPGDAALAAWLHRTAVHASIDLWRSEIRRRNRENYAVAMQTDPNETAPWNDLAPVLDDAVNELTDADRQAIVLRFFADKSMRDVGAGLGVSEDAAKMRVSRALERLRHLVGARGVSCGALALATMLAEYSVEAAPAHVAAGLAALKLPAPVVGITTPVLVGGVATLLLVGAAFWFLRSATPVTRPLAQPTVTLAQADATGPTTTPANSGATPGTQDPDPLALLHAVARARERIASGSMEFYGFSEYMYRGQRATNHLRLAALFDGPKLRFESVGREYRYVLMGEGASEISDAKIQELGLDQEGAARAGLLTAFESRHVFVHDGAVLMDYCENDKRSVGTTIKNASEGGSGWSFNPRCLGLRAHVYADSKVEDCLGYNQAKAINLLGKELVEDRLAWHVQVQTQYDAALHFWLDVDHPTRVLKHAAGQEVAISKYGGASPLPVEVSSVDRHFKRVISQTSAQLNPSVDPSSFTLAGLGMQVGTAVSDNRISRHIGYWTGTGLSEGLPPKQTNTTKAQPPPNLAELMALLENNPTSHFALEAAVWILRNVPDGPEVEKAAEVIVQEHIENPELLQLCEDQNRMRHRSSKRLLQAALDKNPNPDIKATACLTLAMLLKHEAKHGLNKKETAEAGKLFDRLIREYPKSDLARRAKPELHELRRLTVGSPAPEMEGVDLDGQPMRLTDYRGKVVVLHFWSIHYDEPEQHHKLVANLAGKPFALIGVNSDNNLKRAQAAVEKFGITWPSFFDGASGPIRSNWNVNTWPSILVLDQNGIIRHYDLRGNKLEEAVKALLH